MIVLPPAEQHLSLQDSKMATIIASEVGRWPSIPIEDPLWGLLRIVMAQQISTSVACQIAEQVRLVFPALVMPSSCAPADIGRLRELGLPQRRAQCCAEIVQRSDQIRRYVCSGQTWEEALIGIKGIGPWTLAVFRIMVLREPNVLPLGDVGLQRAIGKVYGPQHSVQQLSENWRPYRSVACWYLWRTLGNQQLG